MARQNHPNGFRDVPVVVNTRQIKAVAEINNYSMINVDVKDYVIHDLVLDLIRDNKEYITIVESKNMDKFSTIITSYLTVVPPGMETSIVNEKKFGVNGVLFDEKEIEYAIKCTFPERLI